MEGSNARDQPLLPHAGPSPSRPVRLLLIEDTEVDAAAALRALRRAGYQPEAVRVDSREALEAALGQAAWDAILCDYRLPGFDGAEALQICRRAGVKAPFILLAGTIQDDRAAELMRLGARDFVPKSNPARLPAVLDRELAESVERQARRAVQRELEALREQERQRATMIGAASHELRNPLAPIKAYVHMLEKGRDPLTEEQRKHLAVIRRNVNRVTALTADLLDLARLQAGRMALKRMRVDLVAIVTEAVEGFAGVAAENGVRLELEQPAERYEVEVDPARIGQVLYNLLSNALKFTPEGGVVRVAFRSEQGHAAVRVSDTGAGLRAEEIPLLFRPFSQAQAGAAAGRAGAGLGLSICKVILEAHGGSIEAASDGPGAGSAFTLFLPVAHGGSPSR